MTLEEKAEKLALQVTVLKEELAAARERTRIYEENRPAQSHFTWVKDKDEHKVENIEILETTRPSIETANAALSSQNGEEEEIEEGEEEEDEGTIVGVTPSNKPNANASSALDIDCESVLELDPSDLSLSSPLRDGEREEL